MCFHSCCHSQTNLEKLEKRGSPKNFQTFFPYVRHLSYSVNEKNHSCLLWLRDSFLWGMHSISSLATLVSLCEKKQPQRKTESRLHARGINERCRGLNRQSYFSFLPDNTLHLLTLPKTVCPQYSRERDSATFLFIADKIIRKATRADLVPFHPSN